MKIAINSCYGGFSVSEEVYNELGFKWDGYGFVYGTPLEEKYKDASNYYAYRAAPELIAAIEKVGLDKASGELSKIKIVDIPDDVAWEIDEYDGYERVIESRRSWG
jgi:hypothetical protein